MVRMKSKWRNYVGLVAPGVLAFLLAALSIADMFLPRPYDGVILESDRPGSPVVRFVVPGSGADRAGIESRDVIVGIDRTVLEGTNHAQEILNRHRIGDRVPYLIRREDGNAPAGHMAEVMVELGRRRIGDTSYLYAVLLGLAFFGVGTFVLIRQPRLLSSRVFFHLCALFLLFLVCRLRPASYSWVDSFVLTTGTMALLLLPAVFLHFFLIFPRPIWEWRRDLLADAVGWIAARSRQLLPLYVVPPVVYGLTVLWARRHGTPLALISGAPMTNWWVMVIYMTLGLGALGVSAAKLPDGRERRGAGIVFLGAFFGIVPFIVLAVAFPSFLHTERFLFYGVVPLILVPVTFAYAIVRFQLLNIRVILRKSVFYTVTTALVTVVYALAIAFANHLFRGTALADSVYFPVAFALAIVLLFEPFRQRLQGPVDRFFFAERHRLQGAMVDMGEAMTDEVELGPVVGQLVERLHGWTREAHDRGSGGCLQRVSSRSPLAVLRALSRHPQQGGRHADVRSTPRRLCLEDSCVVGAVHSALFFPVAASSYAYRAPQSERVVRIGGCNTPRQAAQRTVLRQAWTLQGADAAPVEAESGKASWMDEPSRPGRSKW